jgi:ABC-type bacteriocin/lantibiotic exporter with double-glycine peptidase domain
MLASSVVWLGGSVRHGLADEPPTNESSATEARNGPSGDIVCGPRCVQFLLRYYGREDEQLIDLVRELQWPQLEAGTSLADIEANLRRHAIHTHALSLGAAARLDWPHPVVVHLDASDRTMGHFVVLLPPMDGDVVTVWAGLQGIASGNWLTLRTRMSGYALLTSPTPIARPTDAASDHDTMTSIVRVSVITILVALSTIVCRNWTRRQAHPTPRQGAV